MDQSRADLVGFTLSNVPQPIEEQASDSYRTEMPTVIDDLLRQEGGVWHNRPGQEMHVEQDVEEPPAEEGNGGIWHIVGGVATLVLAGIGCIAWELWRHTPGGAAMSVAGGLSGMIFEEEQRQQHMPQII